MDDLKLTPQEQKIVDYHRNTIKGGGVGEDQHGNPVTVYTNTIPTGKGKEHANVPGYVGGKILDRDELQQLFKDEIAEGKWPTYKSGREADRRAKEIHQIYPGFELAWDGGINEFNLNELVDGGINVLNVGKNITLSENPEDSYNKLMLKLS